MASVKPPNYVTGRRGKNWTYSLQAAQRNGAQIVAEETDTPVVFDREPGGYRPSVWIDADGHRYHSRECIPVFP